MASKQHEQLAGARPGHGGRSRRARAALTATAAFTVVASLGLYGSSQALAAGSARPGVGTARSGVGSARPGSAARTSVVKSPLGQEHWSTATVAPGVQVSTVTLSNAASPFWTVTVEQPVTSKVTGSAADAEVETGSWARAAASRLRTDGFQPRVEAVPWPDYSDTPHGLMGYRVRVGNYPTQAAAATAAAAVTAAGFTTTTEWTGYDASTPATLENIHVAVVDPKVFTGTVEGTHDGALAQRQTPSAVADQLGSLVATNGGFFVMDSGDGIPGTQSGLGVYNGKPESLASGARAALVIQDNGKKFQVANLTSSAVAQVGGSRYAVHGVNRVPGTVRDCGLSGATPTTHPEQDIDCYESNDLVLFTGELGTALPAGAGTQAVLDPSGRVVSVGARGGSVPAGDTVLQGIGTASTWLSRQAVVGKAVHVSESVRNAATGASIPLVAGTSIVSAAPLLVQNGRTDIDAAAEGVVDPQDLSFNYQWANARQPRTIAGVDAHGDLLLVTVDGRLTAGSEGFTLAEEAAFMRSLGAVQALNLDGGGSTAMAVDGNLVTNPSDATGERPVGDTVQVLP